MKKKKKALEIENLTVSYDSKPALLDISISVESGLMIGIIGPNGAGKSTLIKAILGFVEPDFGEIKIFGKSHDEAKGKIAYVPQRRAVDWQYPITVKQVALLGRYGDIPWWREPTAEDREIVDNALNMVKMSEFENRQIGQLSGGQQQRVFLARALAQQAEMLLLDEPFAGVDAATERAISEVLERAKNKGQTLIVVHHDLTTAAEYFDRLVLLKQRLYAYGSPDKVLDIDLLSEVYEGRLKAFSNITKTEEAG